MGADLVEDILEDKVVLIVDNTINIEPDEVIRQQLSLLDLPRPANLVSTKSSCQLQPPVESERLL